MNDHNLRPSGIDRLGDIPWGTHLCQFYRTRDDLTGVLAPFFRAGLENGEYCVWITSEPLDAAAARDALRAEVPDAETYFARGQIEIVPHDDWYLRDGAFDLDRVLGGWLDKLGDALARGYHGLRVTGNTAWLEKPSWADFSAYERAIDDAIGGQRMIAICTYSLDRCGASEIAEVIHNHHCALLKRDGDWALVESTERTRAAEALRATEARYRRIVETAAEGIWMMDAQSRTTFANRRMADMLGCTPEELARSSMFDFLDEAVRGALERSLDRRRAGITERYDLRLRRRDGGDLWAIISGTPIFDADQRFVGVLDMVTDITDRKHAEAERERLLASERAARAEAEALAEVRERLVDILGHDLRQPLNVATITVETLRRRLGDSETRAIERLQRNVGRMTAMISDLLDYARSRSAGGLPVTRRPIDLSVVCQRVVEDLRAVNGDHRLALEAKGDCSGRWDAERLAQLVGNLAGNALRYGNTTIELSGHDGEVLVAVHNDGEPIEEAALASLFEPFRRVAERSPSGLGLGLYIVREIARAHGGSVAVRSGAHAGTTFTVRLPREEPGRTANAPS